MGWFMGHRPRSVYRPSAAFTALSMASPDRSLLRRSMASLDLLEGTPGMPDGRNDVPFRSRSSDAAALATTSFNAEESYASDSDCPVAWESALSSFRMLLASGC